MELVDHGRLETVVQRVQPSDPRQPRLHGSLRDQVTGVDDEQTDGQTRDLGSSIEGREVESDGSEETKQGERSDVGNDPQGEESASRLLKVAHEVD